MMREKHGAQSKPLKQLHVRKVSHVGGHIYAGNVMMYSGKGCAEDGNIYGYVTPETVNEVISGTAAKGKLWRGRVGLGDDATRKEYRIQRLKDSAPVVLAVSVAAIAALLYLRKSQRS
eukprot:TRINITY_DN38644_c0_g1_i2.p1 TRINITY_DN38644_c0_g1~~TRINITY_DN38644_c0_g1_i2.p1  ORF type:complete len:118 (+),score=23.11 TRINITY_DN38644_c0_g1_i2:376-729(+)